jgi:hypothetical protein
LVPIVGIITVIVGAVTGVFETLQQNSNQVSRILQVMFQVNGGKSVTFQSSFFLLFKAPVRSAITNPTVVHTSIVAIVFSVIFIFVSVSGFSHVFTESGNVSFNVPLFSNIPIINTGIKNIVKLLLNNGTLKLTFPDSVKT